QRAGQSASRPLADEEAVDVVMSELWAMIYRNLVVPVEAAWPPAPDAIVRVLEDFIKRGGEVSGRPQEGLTAYWRWVVCGYGPALLEALGTFRFLMTELVPLHL